MIKLTFVKFRNKKTSRERVMLNKISFEESSRCFVFNASEWERLEEIEVENLSALKELNFKQINEALSEVKNE